MELEEWRGVRQESPSCMCVCACGCMGLCGLLKSKEGGCGQANQRGEGLLHVCVWVGVCVGGEEGTLTLCIIKQVD